MDKSRILEAIKQIAAENGGNPPGSTALQTRTGIRKSDWYPDIWLRWGDALIEAGFTANKLQTAVSHELLIQKYIDLARELKALPLEGEIRRKSKVDKTFPSHTTFGKFGGKRKLIDAVLRYCKERSGYEDIAALCENHRAMFERVSDSDLLTVKPIATGFVYLMKSGRHYKIGHTNSVGSRERQLAIKIPVPPTNIHSIETDDPPGVEAYWHRRFDAKRGEGEWFDLSPEDVRAFRRWKRIV